MYCEQCNSYHRPIGDEYYIYVINGEDAKLSISRTLHSHAHAKGFVPHFITWQDSDIDTKKGTVKVTFCCAMLDCGVTIVDGTDTEHVALDFLTAHELDMPIADFHALVEQDFGYEM